MSERRMCQDCGRWVLVTKAEVLRAHQGARGSIYELKRCPGSGWPVAARYGSGYSAGFGESS